MRERDWHERVRAKHERGLSTTYERGLSTRERDWYAREICMREGLV